MTDQLFYTSIGAAVLANLVFFAQLRWFSLGTWKGEEPSPEVLARARSVLSTGVLVATGAFVLSIPPALELVRRGRPVLASWLGGPDTTVFFLLDEIHRVGGVGLALVASVTAVIAWFRQAPTEEEREAGLQVLGDIKYFHPLVMPVLWTSMGLLLMVIGLGLPLQWRLEFRPDRIHERSVHFFGLLPQEIVDIPHDQIRHVIRIEPGGKVGQIDNTLPIRLYLVRGEGKKTWSNLLWKLRPLAAVDAAVERAAKSGGVEIRVVKAGEEMPLPWAKKKAEPSNQTSDPG